MEKYLFQKYIEGGLKEEVKKDFSLLMKYEGVNVLGFRVYTPSFNDGDVCEYSIVFLDKINHSIDDYVLLREGNNIIVVDKWEKEWDGYPEATYKNPNWNMLVSEMAPLFLETNQEGLILLEGDSVRIHSRPYYDGY